MTIDYLRTRERMVATQLRARGITDERVLEAFQETPRHEFVDAALSAEAYADRPLPIGESQTISQPYMVGVMTASLRPQPGDRILEIGTGSGYQAAVLSRLVRSVYTIERLLGLAEHARQTLRRLGITNVIQRVGDGSRGWLAYAPYEGIVVTAGAPDVSPALLAQLMDGGRLVIPVGSRGVQRLSVIVRRGNSFERNDGFECTFVPLVGEHGWDAEGARPEGDSRGGWKGA